MSEEYGAMPPMPAMDISDYEGMEKLARRGYKFGSRRQVREMTNAQKRKGPGYTRKMRKGRKST